MLPASVTVNGAVAPPRRGRAVLCFPPHAAWFQGYFFPAGETTRHHVALFGTELPVDACEMCPDGGFQRFRVEVTDFATQREAQLEVIKRGGELCRLTSDDYDASYSGEADAPTPPHRHVVTEDHDAGEGARLRFDPRVLLTDERAVEAIKTYFPSIAARAASDEELAECAVCMGDMKIQGLDFQATTASEHTSN